MAIREAIKFIKNDTDSSVRTRMLLGLIDPQTAALMRSEDWTCQQVRVCLWSENEGGYEARKGKHQSKRPAAQQEDCSDDKPRHAPQPVWELRQEVAEVGE